VTHSPHDITRLLERHGLAPRRAFGQNFVVDPNTVRRIATLSGVGPGDHVLEIGAGLGSLTLALAETGATVVAVEIDNGMVVALREVVGHLPNVEVLHADAAALDWNSLAQRSLHWHVVANLPYNIATPLVADLLDTAPAVEHLLVMVQREVADRFVAGVGADAYGAVSVKIAYWATARIVGDVPPSVFIPRPKVTSALVDIRRRPEPAIADIDPQALVTLVRKGFAQRRKMLRRALAGVATVDDFDAAGIAPESRAEELDVQAWGRLANAIGSRS
jgi:16S rRNA (adenine1518-N6/adenine1519-N6)-dimethyltransferase